MRFLSVCSGIEAASCAWRPLGWKAVAFSEIEPFPCAVLAHHYPETPNWGDMTKYKDWPDVPIDLLCGGTPCQSYSVAGLRKGLADPRGDLMLTFGAIAAKYRPRWLVWENVAGILSSNGGRDFGTFLGLLGELGYGFAYRVLDAQYVRVESHPRAVPQRRRRVFVVGHLGDWRRAAAVLFERESLRWHSPPSRKAGTGIAVGALAGTSPGGGWRVGADEAAAGQLIAFGGNNTAGPIEVATARSASASASGRLDFESETFLVSHSLRGEGFDASEDGTGRGTPLGPVAYRTAGDGAVFEEGAVTAPLTTGTDPSANILAYAIQAGALRENPDSGPQSIGVQADHAFTLEARSETQCVAFDTTQITSKTNGSNPKPGDPCHTLAKGQHAPAIAGGTRVRRMTPLETERLMGMRDGYTAIPVRGKPAADGPRYKSHGNSWAVNCARWLGERIEAVDAIPATQPIEEPEPA